MGKRRSAALRDTAGVHHVASRLAYEGLRPTVAADRGAVADVLVGSPDGSDTVPLAVRTTECPPGFGVEGNVGACEWRLGKEVALTDDPDLFVALIDLRRSGGLPGVWIIPSDKAGAHLAPSDGPRGYRLRASGKGLALYRDDWDAIEDRLRRKGAPQTGWFDREELKERYGEEFVEALNAEASRLLGAQNSTIPRMADERFLAEDLADASALLSVLFRRYMEAKRERRAEERRRGEA